MDVWEKSYQHLKSDIKSTIHFNTCRIWSKYLSLDKLIKRFISKFNDSEFLKEIGFVEYISLLLCWTYTILHKQVASRPLTSVHLPFPPCFNNLLSCTFVICFPNPVNNCVEYVKIFIFPNNSVFQWIITKFKTILKFYWLNSNYLHKKNYKTFRIIKKKQYLLIRQRPPLTKQYKYQQTMVYIWRVHSSTEGGAA